MELSLFYYWVNLNFGTGLKKPSMIKLIIVDDHFHVRQAWSWVLNQVPRLNVIAQCANGQEAIEAAKNLRPDVILMDINMTPVNGIEATRSIREFAPDMKIIGVSVQAERSYVNEMLRNGANGYVTKNSPSTEMVIAIDEVLAGKTYICEEILHPVQYSSRR
jgi:two-component system invasion response regulator UvrY